MEREIKFRGKDLRTGSWVYGSLICGSDLSGSPFTQIEIADANDYRQYNVDPSTVGQFTGLLDDSEKELYDGDIIENINGVRLAIEWNDDTLRWQLSDGEPLNDGPNYGSTKYLIGNVTDNPELLTNQK